MTDTTAVETATTPKPRSTPGKAARASEPDPAPKPPTAKPTRAKHPIVRPLPRGVRFDPDAVITINVPNPKLQGCAAWRRWEAGYTTGGSVKDTFAVQGGPRLDDLRYDYERAFIEIVPAPAMPPKNKK